MNWTVVRCCVIFSVYGLGSIGSNLLVALAKQYPDATFHGYDFDKVEERNIRNQAFFLEQVGLHKADALRIILARHVRRPQYFPHRKRITQEDKTILSVGKPKERELMLDCFDNTESREILASCTNRDVLHIGFSPEYTAECIWNETYSTPNDVKGLDICSMDEAILFIHYVISAASMTISHWVKTGEKMNFLVKRDNKGRMNQVYL